MTSAAPLPSKDLMREVRIGFIRQGTTFTDWCRRHDLHVPAARSAVIGTWDGPKGRAMRARIVRAARIEVAA